MMMVDHTYCPTCGVSHAVDIEHRCDMPAIREHVANLKAALAEMTEHRNMLDRRCIEAESMSAARMMSVQAAEARENEARAELSRLTAELTALRPDGPTTPAVCRAMASHWTKLAEGMEAGARVDEESGR